MTQESKIGYMDKIDFEDGLTLIKAVVFPSIEDLKLCKPCVEECGIVKVEIKLVEVIQETKLVQNDE